MSKQKALLLVFGNQLFPDSSLQNLAHAEVFMAEDLGLCTYVRHHQQKIVLFLAAMRNYAERLRSAGFRVHYRHLEPDASGTYEDRLRQTIEERQIDELIHFEIEDKPMEKRIVDLAESLGIARTELSSPMFLCARDRFRSFVTDNKRLLMADFYRQERVRLNILVDEKGAPAGDQWSFDAENRKKLPRGIDPPELPAQRDEPHVEDVVSLVREEFPDHPGDARDFSWPTTRDSALAWVDDFLERRFASFGPYEDAMTTRSATVFHSVLSPVLNLGLITPAELIDAAVTYAERRDVPLQSVEGFVRQVIGWREFIRGIYQVFSEEQESRNFWRHDRDLTDDWYTGTTGILPLDNTILTARQFGWTHHIPRLMVVANLMTLCEIRPAVAHRWFMEMYIDSSDWVMGPNVYGMGLFSDGGVFATKPYICGSNYLLKMSDYPRGDWCDTVDGLYWRFIDKHRDFFLASPRLALMPRALERLDKARRVHIFQAAEDFLRGFTG